MKLIQLPVLDFEQKLKQEIEEKTGWEVLNIMIYYWTKLSYIPWHEDPGLNAGFSLYLNETWDKDWGGYFMYELEEGQIKALIPTRNTAVIQEGNVPHSVSTINMDSEIRISLQVFFDSKINLQDFYRAINLKDSTSFEEIALEIETLGGFLIEKVKKIPRVGQVIIHDSYKFIVEIVDKKRIKQVKLIIPKDK